MVKIDEPKRVDRHHRNDDIENLHAGGMPEARLVWHTSGMHSFIDRDPVVALRRLSAVRYHRLIS